MRLTWVVLPTLASGAAACSFEPPPATEEPEAASPTVRVVSLLETGGSGAALRVRGVFGNAPLPRLFSGALSDYHLARADEEVLPKTLEQRRVPIWVGQDAEGPLAVALDWLAPGQEYSLVFAPGEVQSVVVEPTPVAWLRLWPNGSASTAALFCPSTESAGEGLETAARLSDGSDAGWETVTALPGCRLLAVSAEVSANGGVSPARLGQGWVAPTLFSNSAKDWPEPTVQCADGEERLGIGCALVMDDRIIVRAPSFGTPDENGLWLFSGSVSGALRLGDGERAVLSGFAPKSAHELTLRILNRDGREWVAEASVHTAENQPHIVINEVLANPLGPEPAEEWVELFNDGQHEGELLGWELRDGGGSVELPEVTIAPGEYVVLTTEQQGDNSGWDVPFASQAEVVRLPVLAKGGLANSGEPLILSTSNGRDISRFPPVSSSAQGVSIARCSPDAVDDAGSSFGSHAAPGASPGAANQLAAGRCNAIDRRTD
jgi:hypothetical protein